MFGDHYRILEKLQNRAKRNITDCPYDVSAKPLLRHLILPSVAEVIHQESASMVYKATNGQAPPRIFFPYTIESIPVHRKHPKFPSDPDFQVAVAVSILRVLNAWQERKLTNIYPDSDSELDSNSET